MPISRSIAEIQLRPRTWMGKILLSTQDECLNFFWVSSGQKIDGDGVNPPICVGDFGSRCIFLMLWAQVFHKIPAAVIRNDLLVRFTQGIDGNGRMESLLIDTNRYCGSFPHSLRLAPARWCLTSWEYQAIIHLLIPAASGFPENGRVNQVWNWTTTRSHQ